MAKLSDRQKNNIIAKWNTGSYTKTQLAKTYKVSEKIIRNIVGKEEPTNADVVKAQVQLETFKKSEKSPIEIKAINQAVKYELDSIEYKNKNVQNIHDITNDILIGLKNSLQKGKVQKVVSSKLGSDVMDIDYSPIDYKNAIETVDKASLTLGVNDRFASSANVAIQNNQSNNQKVEIEGYSVETIS